MSKASVTVITGVCESLSRGQHDEASGILREQYPFLPILSAGRRYSVSQLMRLHWRDGFVDRYTGSRLVFPGTLRLLSKLLPAEFPFDSHWKTDKCHIAYWELFPTLDHVVPISRGGMDDSSNWVTTSMGRNAAKANFTLEGLEWTLRPAGNNREWDGLTSWFLDWARKDSTVLSDPYLLRWHKAACQFATPNEPASG